MNSNKGPNGRLTPEAKVRILELRKNGKKIHEIARELDITTGTAWRYCKGIPAGGATKPEVASGSSSPQA